MAFRKSALAWAAMTTLSASPFTAGAADEATLDTVVVRGEKIERKLEETLSSVAVSTAQDLREHGDRSLNDVLVRTPGVYTTANNKNWGIRGVPVSGFDEQGPATLNGAVSVYIDGALQPNRSLTLSPLMLWDVDQIEIFRGPQSTVQGRNALAGAVIVQTKRPTFLPSLAAQVNAGNYGERGGAAAIGGGLVDGLVAGRLAFDYQESDGYIRNVTLGKDADPHRTSNLRGKLLVQPSENLDILLSLAHSRNRQGDNAVALIDDRPRYYELFSNTDAFDRTEQDTGVVKIDYRLSDAWSLTSTTSTTRSEYDALLDFDENPTDELEVVREHEGRLTSEELRLAYEGDAVRAHVGAYYGRFTNEFDDRLNAGDTPFGAARGDTEIVNRAVFGEVNWTFAPNWQLIAGLRHDRERNDTEITQDDFSAPGDVEQDSHATLPKLGVSYTTAPGQLLGATVQRGYRSGGVNVRAGAGHTAYDPEYTTNYEVSYRGAWLDKRLRTSANVYYTDWRDQQVSMLDDTGNFLEVRNAAESRMKGLEASVDFDATRALRLSTGVAYNDGEYRRFVTGGNDLSGQSFLFAPKWMWTVGARYRIDDLTLNADLAYRDDSPSQYLFDDGGRVSGVRRSDSYAVVNLNAEYRFAKGATLAAYVKNLFDEEYLLNNRDGARVDVGAPRRIGAVLRYEL